MGVVMKNKGEAKEVESTKPCFIATGFIVLRQGALFK